MTLQAGAAAQVLDSDPAFVRRALDAIADTGRTTLDELDHVLGLLRDDAAGRPSGGGPGTGGDRPDLTALPQLLDGVRAGGARIVLHTAGDLAAVPAPVSREAYRLVQEAVTNALRHAPGAPLRLDIDTGSGCDTGSGSGCGSGSGTGSALRVRIENPVTGPPVPSAGRGLRGMTERAAALGGSARAGREDGTWVVEAHLPRDGVAP